MSSPQQVAPERSIFGVDPLDDFVTMVGDWIYVNGRGKPNLEIEGKIGQIIDQETGERVQLPVRNETIVDLSRTRFDSRMTISQHAQYNRILNSLVSRSGESSYTGAKISYHRRKEIDYFHPAPSGKVRVTRDAETLAIKPDGIVQKQRIADLNIYCPNRLFDYRISINVEKPADEPTSEHVSIREKNRLSYAHQNFIVDLTQVTVPEKPQEPIHELEIEIKDVEQLMQAGAQAKSNPASNGSGPNGQEWTSFDDQVLIFLNNIRMLIRNGSAADDRR
ncbi:mRNA capping enzyme, beta subunit, structural domain protein [Kalmanozyma brasiliensis GHG001]|uniref:mRNA capping enzyme, beta subunit, structural domain protein n=1 Tax=Kalmanozyma brasiliensis (strain GHG001) TaxID=1365824 RepID=UPI002867E8AB|nr:mRNA capping enzyme, beta subunit, structural domain protein [Kalmanozyma brasiliensis GHG001]EST08917.2 mRNA capping enzyme, beta subunit, structural domain protein [Kalmanozyma brasiliensis GHG001]